MEMNAILDPRASCANARMAGEVSIAMVSRIRIKIVAMLTAQSARMTMLAQRFRPAIRVMMGLGARATRPAIWSATKEDWRSSEIGRCAMLRVSPSKYSYSQLMIQIERSSTRSPTTGHLKSLSRAATTALRPTTASVKAGPIPCFRQ